MTSVPGRPRLQAEKLSQQLQEVRDELEELTVAERIAHRLAERLRAEWARDAAGLMPVPIDQLVKPVIKLCEHYDVVPAQGRTPAGARTA
jgi:hypothetical protein